MKVGFVLIAGFFLNTHGMAADKVAGRLEEIIQFRMEQLAELSNTNKVIEEWNRKHDGTLDKLNVILKQMTAELTGSFKHDILTERKRRDALKALRALEIAENKKIRSIVDFKGLIEGLKKRHGKQALTSMTQEYFSQSLKLIDLIMAEAKKKNGKDPLSVVYGDRKDYPTISKMDGQWKITERKKLATATSLKEIIDAAKSAQAAQISCPTTDQLQLSIEQFDKLISKNRNNMTLLKAKRALQIEEVIKTQTTIPVSVAPLDLIEEEFEKSQKVLDDEKRLLEKAKASLSACRTNIENLNRHVEGLDVNSDAKDLLKVHQQYSAIKDVSDKSTFSRNASRSTKPGRFLRWLKGGN